MQWRKTVEYVNSLDSANTRKRVQEDDTERVGPRAGTGLCHYNPNGVFFANDNKKDGVNVKVKVSLSTP